jgi:2-keto-3-deoxy-galactonokinase
MEMLRPWLAGARGAQADRAGADGARARARELAEVELRAAIAMVARNPAYRVLVCGMATDARLIAGFDEVAAGSGVVLERRIRSGGGVDVVVRAA